MSSPAAVSARFVLAPAALAGAAGWLRPARGGAAIDLAAVRVDVVLHAGRDCASIAYCLAGLCAQTLRPRRVRLVVGAGLARDASVAIAREFAHLHALPLEIVELRTAGGCTAVAALQANALDGDVLVALDTRTVLESPDWIERCVEALLRDPLAVAACGVRLPLGDADRRRWAMSDPFRRWLGGDAWRDPLAARGALAHLSRRVADAHGECTGLVQQRFVEPGLARLAGGTGRPRGAVAYRRRGLAAVAASMPAQTRDALSLGVAFARAGLRTAPVPGAYSRTHAGGGLGAALRARFEGTRALLGAALACSRGGGALRAAALDRVAVPVCALVLVLAGQGTLLAVLAAAETVAWLAVLAAVAPAHRGRMLARGVLVAPLRWLDAAADALAAGAVAWRRLRQRSEWPVAS